MKEPEKGTLKTTTENRGSGRTTHQLAPSGCSKRKTLWSNEPPQPQNKRGKYSAAHRESRRFAGRTGEKKKKADPLQEKKQRRAGKSTCDPIDEKYGDKKEKSLGRPVRRWSDRARRKIACQKKSTKSREKLVVKEGSLRCKKPQARTRPRPPRFRSDVSPRRKRGGEP